MKPNHILNKHLLQGLVLGAGLLTQAVSHADPIFEVKDWSLSERALNNGSVCVASAMDKGAFRSEIYYLEITKTKNNPNSPVEILLRVEKNKRENTGFIAHITDSPATIGFSHLSTEGNIQTFWGVPKNLTGLLNQLKNGDRVELDGHGGRKDIDFPIKGRGSKDILAEMERLCNQGQPLINAEFEAKFANQSPDNIDGTRISSEQTANLRRLYHSAYATMVSQQATKADLARVLAKYQQYIDELNQNRATHSQITNVDLPNSRRTVAEARQAQVDARAEIARLTQLIPSLQSKVQQSQAAYDQAQAILAPHVPEHNRLVSNLQNAEDNLDRAEARLSQIDSRLRQLASEIDSLERESDRLESGLQNKRWELREAQSRLRDAENARSSYNVSFERDRKLRENQEYNNLNQEARDLDHHIPEMDRQVDAQRADRDQKQSELNQCRSVAGQDCSAQEAGLNQANSELSSAVDAQRQLRVRRNAIDQRRRDIENETDREVQGHYNQLVQREQEARRRVNDIDDDIRDDESRISQINNVDLPRRQNEQRNLENERFQVQNQISQARNDVARSERDLANFEASTDWNRKYANVQNTAAQLRADQNTLDQAVRAKAAQESRLQQNIQLETDMKNRIQALEAQVVALDQRKVVLDQKLAGLPAERAPLDQKIASDESQILAARNEFLRILQ
jgi:chromosome segregation ATPase